MPTSFPTNPLPFFTYGLSVAVMYAFGTFSFDVVHYFFHRFPRSRFRFLRRLSYLHTVHHLFYDQRLQFQSKYRLLNIGYELPLEYFSQCIGYFVGFIILHQVEAFSSLSVVSFYTVMGIGLCRTLVVIFNGGMDSNHPIRHPASVLPVNRSHFFVGPTYHAMHHLYPDTHYSSLLSVFDLLSGTAYRLRGLRVAMTGANGAFGAPLKRILMTDERVNDIVEIAYGHSGDLCEKHRESELREQLKDVNLLIICHGSKLEHAMDVNCDSVVRIIEIFLDENKNRKIDKTSKKNSLILPEVWALGSEIELHPSWNNSNLLVYSNSKRALAKYARHYFSKDNRLTYRHIVPSAFRSRMGWGLLSGEQAARWALFWIRRGFRYVPVTYTGIAWLNYVKFIWFVKPLSPDQMSDELNEETDVDQPSTEPQEELACKPQISRLS